MSIQVADLVANLRGEDAGFTTLMGLADAKMTALGKSTEGGIGAVRGFGLALGAVAAGVLVDSIKKASDYQIMLAHVQANTGMSTAAMATMSSTILQMSASTGAPLAELSDGFMHIANFGFNAKDAMLILKPAMESALSTGDNVGQVASTLAVALHEFHLGADQAATSMNVLHLAAQMGNSTLGAFVEGTTQAFNMAGAYRVQLVDVAAALSTLTQSGQTARAASNGLSSTFQGIVKPTAAASVFIKELSHATGVNLVADFSAAGLHARGFSNIMGDVREALSRAKGSTAIQEEALKAYGIQLRLSHVNTVTYTADMKKMALAMSDPAQATNALFANVRAAREVMLLTGSQADSFATHMTAMKKAMGGLIDPTASGFATQQATVAGQMAKIGAAFNVIAIEAGSVLLPALMSLMAVVQPLVAQFVKFATAHPQIVAAVLGIGAAIGALTAASLVAGPALAVLTGPLGLLVAAGALLYEAWTHDWGGIREIVLRAWSAIQPALHDIEAAINQVVHAFRMGGIGAAAREALGQAATLLGQLGNWITGTGVPYLRSHLGGWVHAYWGWVESVYGPLVGALGGLLGRLGSWITGTAAPAIGAQLRSWASAFVAWIGPAVTTFLQQWPGMLNRFLDWIGSAAAPILTKLANWGLQFIAWIAPKLPGIVLELTKIALAIFVFINETAITIGAKIIVWAVQMTAWVVTHAVPKLIAAIGSFLAALWPLITAGATALGTHMAKWAPELVAWVADGLNKLRPKVQHITTDIVTWLGNAGAVLLHFGGGLISGLMDGMKAIAPALLHYLEGLGKDIVGGITNGIKSVGGGIAGFLGGHLDDAWNAAKAKVQAHSPSVLYFGLGVNIVQGLINGIKSQQNALAQTVNGMLGTLGVSSGGANVPRLHHVALGGGMSGGNQAVSVTVSSGAIQVHGLGTPNQEADFSRALADGLGDLVKQMISAQRTSGNAPGRGQPGVVSHR